MFDREETINYIWDVYKSIHGIRPRHMKFSDMGDEQLRLLAEILTHELKINMEETDRKVAEAEEMRR